jgi:hypothetical protein
VRILTLAVRTANEERRIGNGPSWLAVAALIAACKGSDSSVIPGATPPNLPPVCVLAAQIDVVCQGTVTQFSLDGSASFDPEGARLTFKWISDCPYIAFDDPTSPTPFVTLASMNCTQACTAYLTVFDDVDLCSSCSIVINVAPLLAGAGVELAVTGRSSAEHPFASAARPSVVRRALAVQRVWLQLSAHSEPSRILATDLCDATRVLCAGELAPGSCVAIDATDPSGLPPCVVIELHSGAELVERARLVTTPTGVELFTGGSARLRLSCPVPD